MSAGCTECFCIPCACKSSEEYKSKDGYEPGTWGCHEALHMAGFIESVIDQELLEHPAIQKHPEWLIEAQRASLAIQRLYQLIGKEHFSA